MPTPPVRGNGWNGVVHIPSGSPPRDEMQGVGVLFSTSNRGASTLPLPPRLDSLSTSTCGSGCGSLWLVSPRSCPLPTADRGTGSPSPPVLLFSPPTSPSTTRLAGPDCKDKTERSNPPLPTLASPLPSLSPIFDSPCFIFSRTLEKGFRKLMLSQC